MARAMASNIGKKLWDHSDPILLTVAVVLLGKRISSQEQELEKLRGNEAFQIKQLREKNKLLKDRLYNVRSRLVEEAEMGGHLGHAELKERLDAVFDEVVSAVVPEVVFNDMPA